MVKAKNLTLSFSSESSIEEELKRESTADVITIAVSFLIVSSFLLLLIFVFGFLICLSCLLFLLFQCFR